MKEKVDCTKIFYYRQSTRNEIVSHSAAWIHPINFLTAPLKDANSWTLNSSHEFNGLEYYSDQSDTRVTSQHLIEPHGEGLKVGDSNPIAFFDER